MPEKLGAPEPEAFANVIPFETSPIDIESHTMSHSVLVRYIAKTKFSAEQYALIDEAIENGREISIHGFYDGWYPKLLAFNGLTLVAGPIIRTLPQQYLQRKEYNRFRPIVLSAARPSNEIILIVVVFPSHEYVQQYAEIVSTYVHIKTKSSRVKYDRPIIRYHYPALEDDVATWTGLRNDLQKMEAEPSLIIMGEITLIRQSLRKLGFREHVKARNLGIDDIFSLETLTDIDNERQIHLFGAQHSYWGSAAGQIAKALAEAGMKHLIYSAKAGTFRDKRFVHHPFIPESYLLLSEDPHRPGYPYQQHFHELRSPLLKIAGLIDDIRTGIHLTVPTVVGETKDQQARYQRMNPSTIDNEIGFIARSLNDLNEEKGRLVSFTALHFITDYLRHPSERSITTVGDLANNTSQYYITKQEQFEKISRIISTYALLGDTTLVQHPDSGRFWNYSIITMINEWGECKSFLDTLDPRRHSSGKMITFLLRLRYAAYYHGDIKWGMSEITRILGAHKVPTLKRLDEVFEVVESYYDIAPGRRSIGPDSDRKLRTVAEKARQLVVQIDRPYVKYVLTVTRIQCLLQAARNVAAGRASNHISTLRQLCDDALQLLSAAELTEDDSTFEMLHFERISGFVDLQANAPEEAVSRFERSLAIWEELFHKFNDDTQWIASAEIALNKIDMLLNGFDPRDRRWYEDITIARARALGRFDLIGRLARSIDRSNVEALIPLEVQSVP